MSDKTPSALYKYQALNKENREWIRKIFTRNEIYFASPKEFKDPFDCRVQSSLAASDNDWESYLENMLKNRHPGWHYDERQAAIKQLVRSGWHEDPGAQQQIVHDTQEAIDRTGVYCISEVPDDILMWSQYADGHRGFCLQFSIVPKSFSFGEFLFQVKYTSSYPQISIVQDREELTKQILLTKSCRWEHEKEWRIIDFDKGKGVRIVPPEMLTGVIFGCEMPYEERQLIREWAKGRKIPLQFSQAMKKEKEFGLEMVKTIG